MIISLAIIKYGLGAFSLEILEYCAPYEAIIREQHYLDLLNPEYNILKIAGSSLGFKHSEKTIAKMKEKKYLRKPKPNCQRLTRGKNYQKKLF